MKFQKCPICNAEVTPSERYPNYACGDCVDRALNKDGHPVKFFNTGFDGGFVAVTEKESVQTKSEDHICFIDNKKFYADEARFGGIVVVPFK